MVERIFELSEEIFGLDFPAYLVCHNNRHFWGFIIEEDEERYSAMFGDPPKNAVELLNESYVEAKAGSSVDVGESLGMNVNADIFLIARSVLSQPAGHIDVIILHELAHIILNADLKGVISFHPTPADVERGKEYYRRTDTSVVQLTQHTEEFCILLAAACRAYLTMTDEFKTAEEAMESALRYELV
jgi:hypothetical protein